MGEKQCVRDVILGVVNDMEQLSRELIESMITNKRMRQNLSNAMDITEIAESLISKNNQLKKLVKIAQEQEEVKKKMDVLRIDLKNEEEEIKHLTKALKEAEHILSTALYQAKHKLSLIKKANEHPISSEELIRYAHKISSTHSVAAPYNWEQGDLRRPYPTDLEMRSGWIAKIQSNDFQMTPEIMPLYAEKQPIQNQGMMAYNSQTPPSSQSQTPFMERGMVDRPSSTASTSSNTSYPWQQDVKPSLPGISGGLRHSSPLDTKPSTNKGNLEDVEVMSTDSSSSSSSDSQ